MTAAPGDGALRILHAPRNIAGQGSDMVAALRRLGHHAELWEDVPDAFGRPADRHLALDPLDARATVDAILAAARDFDVVHFHYARTLVPWRGILPPYWDLPVLRGLGVKVFFTFHGTDARIERLHGTVNPWSHAFGPPAPPEDDRTEKTIQVIRTYASGMFVVSMNYLAYVPDAVYMPRVIDLGAWPETPPRRHARPVLVHAPTRRSTKGTELLLAALEVLRAEGLDFELRLLEGVPHAQVREVLADADVLVDNLVGGSYGIVSLEAMASGAVAVSNYTDAVRRAHPDLPVVHADPDTIATVLRPLLGSADARAAIAARGRPFVAATHAADTVAARLVEAYRAPAAPLREAVMPDWMAMESTRSVEQLQGRIADLQVELARARQREMDLRVRLGLDPDPQPSRAHLLARRVLPRSLRRRLTGRG